MCSHKRIEEQMKASLGLAAKTIPTDFHDDFDDDG